MDKNYNGYRKPWLDFDIQRAITDFDSEVAFGRVNKKLQEHYGIAVPGNGIRTTTLHHAKQITVLQDKLLAHEKLKVHIAMLFKNV